MSDPYAKYVTVKTVDGRPVSFEAKTYPLDAYFRWLMVVVWGSFAILPLWRWTTDALTPATAAAPPSIDKAVFFAVLAVIGWICTSFRVRMDENGLSWRFPYIWHSWPWEAFRSGQVAEDDHADRWTWKSSKGRRRSFPLFLVPASAQREILKVVDRIWVRTAQELPERLEFRAGRVRVSLSADGLAVSDRARVNVCYRWNDVRRLIIRRADPKDRGFTSLEIQLPNRTLHVRTDRNTPTRIGGYQGVSGRNLARPRDLVSFLQREVPESRTVLLEHAGFATEREAIPGRLQELDRDTQMSQWMTLFVAFFFATVWLLTVVLWTVGPRASILPLIPSGAYLTVVLPGLCLASVAVLNAQRRFIQARWERLDKGDEWIARNPQLRSPGSDFLARMKA